MNKHWFVGFVVAVIMLLSAPVFSELGVKDLDKIREIVKESETRVTGQFTAHFNFQGNLIVALLGGQIALIIAVIGLPLYRERQNQRGVDEKEAAQRERDAAQDAKIASQQRLIDAQQQQLAVLQEELASLKREPTA